MTTSPSKRQSKAKLWQVYFQSKKYHAERSEITVNAKNIDQAISNAIKNSQDKVANKRNEIEKVELLATED